MEKPSCRDNPTFRESDFAGKKFYPQMEGKNVFKNACQRMPEAVLAGARAQRPHRRATSIVLIPHQANDRISQMVAHGLKIPEEKVIRNIDRYGNTTSASIPIALDEAVRSGTDPARASRRPDGVRVGIHLGLGRHPMVKSDCLATSRCYATIFVMVKPDIRPA